MPGLMQDVPLTSGGGRISSVELEYAITADPDVVEAAVIAVPHPRWDERPLALVVARQGARLDDAELREFLSERVKKLLRERYGQRTASTV